VAGKADIGGFGVSSDLVWQVYGGVGWQMSKRTALELGYKYFAIDYSDGGFTYDVANSGVMTAFSIKF
jgi:opacity protein-like surface antigen